MTIKIDQVADAFVSVPGVTITMLDVAPGTQFTTSATFENLTGASGSFTAPVAGLYLIRLSIDGFATSNTEGGRYRLVFDAAGTPQNIGSDDTGWEMATGVPAVTRGYKTMFATVTLTAGAHTVKVQWKRTIGTGTWNSDAFTRAVVVGELVSGSGAGGTITESESASSNPTTISSPTYTDYSDVPGLTTSISVSTLETVLFIVEGEAFQVTNYNAFLRWVDGSNNVLVSRTYGFAAGTTTNPLNWTTVYTFPTAGTYTIKLQAKNNNEGTWSFYDPKIAVLQFRGGLVPIRKDGYAITDTPAAIEFVTSGFQVSNVGGTAKIGFTQDTELPRLRYSGVSSISVYPDPGQANGITRITLQDGYQRMFSGNLSWNFTNGVADLGLDTGAEGSNTWYYMYLIPKSGNNGMLSIRASVTPPPVGSTGYLNWKYIGAFYNDAGSRIRRFNQRDYNRFTWFEERELFNVAAADGSPVALPLTSFVPVTADSVRCNGYYSPAGGGFGFLYYFIDGYTSSAFTNVSGGTGFATNAIVVDVPLPNPPPSVVKQIYRQIIAGGGTVNGSKTTILEWSDGYL